jgi:glyoxylase-like metal-dependent hydrolase (beta-lactamase superfamily II)
MSNQKGPFMERIFPNLYRISSAPKEEVRHTYLLTRADGNLLVCHSGGPTDTELNEIEALGGIDSQWVCHQHDVNRDGLHENLHRRFGCELHHHRREKGVRKKTECPVVQFDDDGLTLGSDFEALYYPSCTDGHTVYRWKSQDTYFLFTSHAFYYRKGEWELGVPMPSKRRALLRPQLAALADVHVDYVLPGYTAPDEDVQYQLDDTMRASFQKALAAFRHPRWNEN